MSHSNTYNVQCNSFIYFKQAGSYCKSCSS